MKLLSVFPVSPRNGLRGLAALTLAVVFFGVYFIFLPSRVFVAKAVFRYYPESAAGAAGNTSANEIRNLPEYFIEKPSFYSEIKRVLSKQKRMKMTPAQLSRSLRVQKKEKEPEYAVYAEHADSGAAAALRDVFLLVLIRGVRDAETGYIRNKKKIVEREISKAEKEFSALHKKINSGGTRDPGQIQEDIKHLQGEIEQLSLKKAEAQEILSSLRGQLRREKPTVVSGASVEVNPAYKEAKFRLLDMQSSLEKKGEEEKSDPEDVRALENQIRILTAKIHTRIPKYVEVPQSAPNPAYVYLLQRITRQQMTLSSLSMRMRLLENKLEKQKTSAFSAMQKTQGSGDFSRDAQRVENKIYALQSILEDVKLELLRPDSILVISKTKKAAPRRPLNPGEAAGWAAAVVFLLTLTGKRVSAMRMGVLDFPSVLRSLDVPVLLDHSGREQDNVYVARTVSCICSEIPMKTLLFLVSHARVSSAVCDIAVHLSQKAGRVLLVDADFHMPSLHGFFEVNNETGFYSILCGAHRLSNASDGARIDIIEKHIVPVTSECGFIGTGAPPQDPFKGEIKKENLEAFLDAVRSSGVMLLFYATFEGNTALDALLPYVEGIVVCCPDGEEIYPRFHDFLSFMRKVQHKVIGSVLFPSRVRRAEAAPVLFHSKP